MICPLMWVGCLKSTIIVSYSADQHIRHLMGQTLYCSAADTDMWGDRGYGDGSTLYAWLSSITLLPRLPGFPPQEFLTKISSLTTPGSISRVNSSPHPGIVPQSLNSSSQLLPLPGDLCPCLGVHMAVARTVWFSFHLGCQRSAVSLSALNVSPLTQTIALLWGLDPCFSFLTYWGQVQSY